MDMDRLLEPHLIAGERRHLAVIIACVHKIE
jgi:hypothetical protein